MMHSFVWVLIIYILVRETIENHKSVGAGARKIKTIVRILPNFDPYFPSIGRARKKKYKVHI